MPGVYVGLRGKGPSVSLRAVFLLFVLPALLIGASPSSPSMPAETRQPKPPLQFVENQGQTDPQVKFYLAGARGTVFFTPAEVVFKVVESRKAGKAESGKDRSPMEELTTPRRGVVIRLSFPGADPAARLEGIDPLPGRIHDFQGNDPAQWRSGMRTFGGVAYRGLYPGVDLEYRVRDGELKRVLVVKDRAQAAVVRMRYAGPDALRLGDAGQLELATPLGPIREEPIAVEAPGSSGARAALRYSILDSQTVGVLP